MNSQYTIDTVPQNLSKEETIVQIVEVLDHLKSVTQDIFSRIDKRLTQNTDKLTNISTRIDVAANKINTLKDDKKAKTVFSSSKYPAIDVNRDYHSIFKDAPKIERVRHEVKYKKYVSTYEPLSKLQFYHVKMPHKENIRVSDGLGEVPVDTKCINDLLLFNTGKNVYKDFKFSDSLKGPEITNNKEQYSTSELGPAPPSVSQRSSMQGINKENYFYTPKVEELPALDVPWDLPDLPGIADDVRYEIDSGINIAPSAMNSQIADLDLPNILDDDKSIVEESAPPPPPPLEVIPELPIHMPANPAIEVEANKTPVEAPTIVDSGPKVVEEPSVNVPPPPLPVVTLPENNSRANLMDAIRKAGGSLKANLKKTGDQPQNTKNAPTSGDLMADLHSKLLMRRKGIQGDKKADSGNSSLSTADSAFQRLSSIIPPPLKSSDVGSVVSTDDEAWNEDDED
ncbi:unnamed protein product [Ceutorhynchus assimilis]|uniref:WH2 domain-containing protein n=1 Tax=Ceutorhynchus assimilis TaxID=467358 RepID=A0A9N9QI07_9CUCU|nr:unnamed protein product [Ceutorhynchus assimilis]